jgi:hypothetical protein
MTTDNTRRKRRVSRRAFLKGTGLLVAATGAGCAPQAAAPAPAPTPVLTLDDKYLHVPPAPPVPPDPNVLQFFTPAEAQAVEALVGRIIPGTPEDPGAREAGVMTFIDNMLATTEGYAEPTYTRPPYPRFYSGDEPPPEAAETDPAEVIWVPEQWKENFGWQAGAPPQELYRAGLRALDEMAGGPFADLTEAQQDALLEQLSGEGQAASENEPGGQGGQPGEGAEGGGPTGQGGQSGSEGGGSAAETPFDRLGIPGFSGSAFFDMLKQHTVQGMFGDPLYGGNRFLVGWQLVGYPGARRAYTERDMHDEALALEPQSLAHLPPFHPGQPVSDDVIIPLANGDLIQQQAEGSSEAERMQFCQVRR